MEGRRWGGAWTGGGIMMLETLAKLRRQFERRHPEWFDPANYAEALPRELAANQR